jgi:hypothetical protein
LRYSVKLRTTAEHEVCTKGECMKTVAEKFKIIEAMEDLLKTLLETDDVQIIADIELDGDDYESLQKTANA